MARKESTRPFCPWGYWSYYMRVLLSRLKLVMDGFSDSLVDILVKVNDAVCSLSYCTPRGTFKQSPAQIICLRKKIFFSWFLSAVENAAHKMAAILFILFVTLWRSFRCGLAFKFVPAGRRWRDETRWFIDTKLLSRWQRLSGGDISTVVTPVILFVTCYANTKQLPWLIHHVN